MTTGQSAQRSENSDAALENLTTQDINDMLARGEFVEIVSWCGSRIGSHPQDFVPYLSLGLLAEVAGDDQRSAEYFAEAIVRNPDAGVAYAHLGRVFRKLDQPLHAVRALQVAIEMGAAGTDARLDIADLFFEMGDQENARTAYQMVLERRPDCARSKAITRLLPPAMPRSGESAPPQGWERVHITIIAPEGYPHWQAFTPTAAAFANALSEIGSACTIGCNEYVPDGINIVFGAHLIATETEAQKIPAGSIIFNLEQLSGFNAAKKPVYSSILNRFTVWDYSPRNIAWLKANAANANVVRVDLGFAPNMSAIRGTPEQTTDVIFYGSLNERRAAVIDQLKASGLAVKHLFNVYGDALDDELARAKVVLNVHFYEDSIHEIVRTSYLMSNSKAVVTECNPNTEIDPSIRAAMRAVPYEQLVAECVALVKDDTARKALEGTAFAVFSRRSQAQLLRDAIARTPRS